MTNDKNTEATGKEPNRKKAAQKRKKPQKKVSYYVKPEGMTLEEWQIALRRQVAREEKFECRPVNDVQLPGEYLVRNAQKQQVYKVVYRGARSPWNYCSCMDFKTSGLGTCKHIEALKMWLGGQKHYRVHRELPPYTSVYLSYTGGRQVRIRIGVEHREEYEALARRYFDNDGILNEQGMAHYDRLLMEGRRISDSFRFYDDAVDFIVQQREREFREQLLCNYSDHDLDQLLSVTLYPYQHEGVRFAFKTGKSIIADEMGLGKTIQAIATAELLRKERLISSALIVCPTSLKYQWKREIERFAHQEAHVIEGGHLQRKLQYAKDVPYKIVSYHSMLNDIKILGSLDTELLIMDEVQRLKNWNTQIAMAARRIRSDYAVILSGTPLENRLEELYSVMELADQWCLAPYYLFKHECIECDATGKVIGYNNLNRVGELIRRRLIRRTKKGVALQMPPRQDKNLIVPMTKEQMGIHDEYRFQVSLIVEKWQRMHFLSETDRLRLLKLLAQMRMVCDSTYILDQKSRHDTKVEETMNILDSLFSQGDDEKVVIFSQWERMTRLIAAELETRNIGYANLHGAIPSRQRADLIRNFCDQPECRVFLSTDAGSTGLNLQVAATIINLDLPWNPAVLEQRIARIYRLGQQRSVQVINLVSAKTIEEDMIGKLRFKAAMFEGVLDGGDDRVFVGDQSKFRQMMDTLSGVINEQEAQPTSTQETITEDEQEAQVTPQPMPEDPVMSDDADNALSPNDDTDIPNDMRETEEQVGAIASDKSTYSDTPPAEESSTSGIRPATSPQELVSQGVSFLSGLAQTLQSPEATQQLVNSIVKTDEQTGTSTLSIPVPNKETVATLLNLVGKLFSGK